LDEAQWKGKDDPRRERCQQKHLSLLPPVNRTFPFHFWTAATENLCNVRQIPQVSGYDQLPTSMIVCNLEIFHKQFMFLLFCYVAADAFGFSRTFPNAGSMLLHMFVTVFTSA
jgi:hypothetical protein